MSDEAHAPDNNEPVLEAWVPDSPDTEESESAELEMSASSLRPGTSFSIRYHGPPERCPWTGNWMLAMHGEKPVFYSSPAELLQALRDMIANG